MSMPQSQDGRELQPIDFTTGGMHYFTAYTYVFENPNWLMTLLLRTVCYIIPVVGPIVLMGYQYEIVEALHRNPRRIFPDFNFERFAEYLGRGVWPFLVTLVAGMVMGAVTVVPMLLLQILEAAGDHNEAISLAALGMMIVLFVVITVLSFGSYLVMVPLMLRAGLTQEFAKAFDFDFVFDFIRRMWLEMILVALFLWISTLVLMIAGFMLCCIGIYPAMTLMMLANTHLFYQLYEVYLLRGGQSIPLKDPSPMPTAT